jgi:hypothetical protein
MVEVLASRRGMGYGPWRLADNPAIPASVWRLISDQRERSGNPGRFGHVVYDGQMWFWREATHAAQT